MTKVWNIQSLETAPNENGNADVVKTVHWVVDLFEDGDSVNHYGSTELDPPRPTFTPFEELTQEQVLLWVMSKVDEEEIDQILTDKMAARKNPPVVKKTPPWMVQQEIVELPEYLN